MIAYLILGFIIGVLICSIWDTYLGKVHTIQKLKANLYEILEHYHWGLICLIISEYILGELFLGIGVALIIDERLHDKPFGYKKKYFLNTVALGLILMYTYVFIKLGAI